MSRRRRPPPQAALAEAEVPCRGCGRSIGWGPLATEEEKQRQICTDCEKPTEPDPPRKKRGRGQALHGRRGANFSVRVTDEQRLQLEALQRELGGPAGLGPWLLWRALESPRQMPVHAQSGAGVHPKRDAAGSARAVRPSVVAGAPRQPTTLVETAAAAGTVRTATPTTAEPRADKIGVLWGDVVRVREGPETGAIGKVTWRAKAGDMVTIYAGGPFGRRVGGEKPRQFGPVATASLALVKQASGHGPTVVRAPVALPPRRLMAGRDKVPHVDRGGVVNGARVVLCGTEIGVGWQEVTGRLAGKPLCGRCQSAEQSATAPPPKKCRVCGCTEDRPCDLPEGPCLLGLAGDLCTFCAQLLELASEEMERSGAASGGAEPANLPAKLRAWLADEWPLEMEEHADRRLAAVIEETSTRALAARRPRQPASSAELVAAAPFLKWVGGKRALLPELEQHVPPSLGRYHEPFLGGGSLFFHLAATGRLHRGAVLSDSNERLIRAYGGVRDSVEDVIRHLGAYPHDKDFFLELRDRSTVGLSDSEVAAWLIYLNRCGYNGLYRVNKQDRFNVSFGEYENPRICHAENLRACSRALAGVDLRCEPFELVEQRAEAEDFVYFDPPYVPLSASSFRSYTRQPFGIAEQEKLAGLARALKERGVQVLLSNSAAPVVRSLYQEGFAVREVFAPRHVNSRGSGRGRVMELVMY